jgi:hypothetical protein
VNSLFIVLKKAKKNYRLFLAKSVRPNADSSNGVLQTDADPSFACRFGSKQQLKYIHASEIQVQRTNIYKHNT